MQVLISTHAQAGRPTRRNIVTALGLGLLLVAASAVLVYLVFIGNFLDRFMPVGRPSTYELVAGALAYEHWSAARLDLAGINRAFFQSNAFVSAVFLLSVWLAL
jgi:hypothetical protein